jgi:16S rRNA (cytosine1402-N4)-methyltransferase
MTAAVAIRPHVPVMLDEVLAAVAPRAGSYIIDGTFGAGGYATALLRAADCQVLALDRDITAVRAAAGICAAFPNRLTVVLAPFSNLDQVARDFLSTDSSQTAPSIFSQPDAVVLDIGVSSMQLDQPGRGFSFQHDGPLDMRMSATGASAADVVNTASADHLADILFHLGDERQSRKIARAIVLDRETTPFTSTLQLAGLVARLLKTPKIDGRHAATRTFQALRIYVNDELGELGRALSAAERCLKPGGRLAVVTFHSLEDGMVKRFFRARTGRLSQGSRHSPMSGQASDAAGPAPSFQAEAHKPTGPSDAEIARNSRARSARLRWAVRTDAAAWPEDLAALGMAMGGVRPAL